LCLRCTTLFDLPIPGVVIASHDPEDDLFNQRVFLVPNRGWKDDPDAPEEECVFIPLRCSLLLTRFTTRHFVLGGATMYPSGTFSEYIVVEREYVIPIPDHLDDVHAAAWPLGGLTAWRATVVNAAVKKGHNVLITGIGGGVALLVLQICVALGASVYVTSGNVEKIRKAVELGAKGGVNYHDGKPRALSSEGWLTDNLRSAEQTTGQERCTLYCKKNNLGQSSTLSSIQLAMKSWKRCGDTLGRVDDWSSTECEYLWVGILFGERD
jgi:threonine dehydrogenase-like Zn-dependent dehydrogenase